MARRTARVRASVLAAVLLAVGALLVASPPPTAGSDGPCPGTSGVTVVVDYQALGGGVVVRCAPGSPATGFKALQAAGFAIEEVRNVPGFLCRIDSRPGPDREACINTPPASAYWSYWHASRGGAWKVSQEGGKTRTPPVGSVEGWSFSDDGTPGAASPPGIDPPAKPATPKPATPKPTAKPTPKQATPKPATPKPTPGPATPTPGPVTSGPPAPTAIPAATAKPTGSPSTSSPAATLPPSSTVSPSAPATAAAPSAGEPTDEAAAEASSSPPSSPGDVALGGTETGEGSPTSGAAPPVGTLVGIGLLVLVVSGAMLARSRRSAGGGTP